MPKIRPIAIYLPQFHPIPENDEWWGKGFTEWTNVTKAQPKFQGHYQPHLPADLGFYDLRLEEARLAQEALAKEYGIYGFCYYHYWFNGRRILERPLNEKLRNPKEDLPFMMCWANENWSRRWDGSENDILLEQNYSMEDHTHHIKYLIPFFKDPRYIRIDGKCVFSIYRSDLIPDLADVINLWRSVARECNIELYIVRFEGLMKVGKEYMVDGIDASTEFQPHSAINKLNNRRSDKKGLKDELTVAAVRNSLFSHTRNIYKKYFAKELDGIVQSYEELVKADFTETECDYKKFKCVSPGWDNSSRKAKKYRILTASTPHLFREWINHKLKIFVPYSANENLFFINAWNEWAEGNHLEPDRKWGKSYLQELKDALAINENSSH